MEDYGLQIGDSESIEQFKTLKRKYMRLFNSDDGKKVLEDLRVGCYVDAPIENDTQEGMRRVYLHIQTMISGEGMELTEEE